jgi:PKD repeat protein/pimeloyl-ACP methyl ester carboxylesterase
MGVHRWAYGRSLLLVGLCLILLGCPLLLPPDSELYLVVAPSELHFGESLETAVIEVSKSNSAMELSPIVVSSASPWIVAGDCKGVEDGCISSGPFDKVHVPVRVDRSRMRAGANSGTLRVAASGAAAREIPVTATALVVANFFAANRAPETVDVVEFEDRSETAPGWRITTYLWDFGDGTTSTRQNPAPHRYLEEGSYTVSLTVTATNNGRQLTATTVRDDYVIVTGKQSPAAAFTASTTNTFVNTPISFTDQSTPGTAAITSYLWDFGDGATSTQRNPMHTYTDVGTFTVSLTVFSADGNATETKDDFITIQPVPPVANFEASTVTPAVNAPVQFSDLSNPGSAPIVTWLWDFGDGETSGARNPVHTFRTQGTFSVMLRVTSAHGTDTETKTDYITTHTVAPAAAFSATPTRILVDDTVSFTSTATPGSSPITSWLWSFGDGQTSSSANPTHQYTAAGRYTVTLAVTTEHGTDIEIKNDYIAVFEATALDRYIRNGDDSYAFALRETLPATGAKVHVLDLTSQTWREGFVDRPLWMHHLVIVEPAQIDHDTAILFVSGGNTNSGVPNLGSGDVQALVALATTTKSVAVYLRQVPNEPLIFSDETRTRTEDEIIAYTFDQFMMTGDEEWPALFPMVKSVVRAMDAVQDFDNQFSRQVNNFIVTGASKRGWTTWLTAAADTRVIGIAPMVIDVLNMPTQMDHHFNVYGYYAEHIHDYIDSDIFSRLDTPEGIELTSIVDPFAYRERLDIPKYVINGSGDEFFVPDSSQFYFDDLPEPKHLRYVPNAGHGLGGYNNVVTALTPWYQAILTRQTPPTVNWTVEAENRIRVQVDVEPIAAKLWVATSVDRDFRFNSDVNSHTPPTWTGLNLSPTGPGTYIGQVATPMTGWTAFFIELTLPSPFELPYIFTTEARVTPDVYPITTPFPPIVEFTVADDNTTPSVGEPVQFLDLTNTGTRPVILRLWDFGDGTTTNAMNPTHSYEQPGTYDVSLTIQTVYGTVTEIKADYITVVDVKSEAHAFSASAGPPDSAAALLLR